MSDAPRRTSLSDVLEHMRPDGDAFRVKITPDWQQGRAVYGGLSTALCLEAAQRAFDDLPPLRSAMVRFIGPPKDASLVFRARKVRQGRSATFIDVEGVSADSPVVHVSFVFGAARPSSFNGQWKDYPGYPLPDACPELFGFKGAPNFTHQFETRFAGANLPVSGAEHGDLAGWLQHKDAAHHQSVLGLLCLADGMPPAAVAMMEKFSPVSSITWMFDIVGDLTATDDGWFLCRSTLDAIGEGYSSQNMAIWNTAGQPVLVGRQNCAIFA